jgi:hypothetical protein
LSHFFFVVEGVHDVEAVGCLVRRRGYRRIQQHRLLPDYWDKLVPKKFPFDGDLLRRVPVPTFFKADNDSLGIINAIGLEKIVGAVQASLLGLPEPPDGLGILLDADSEALPETRWKEIRTKLSEFDFGEGPGSTGSGAIRSGIFVLPDNQGPGTLEDLLLECAARAYPELSRLAQQFVGPIVATDSSIFPDPADNEDFRKPAGKKKATAGCISSILKPGKAIQVSIQDNAWLKHEEALKLPKVIAVQRFVDQILGHQEAPSIAL